MNLYNNCEISREPLSLRVLTIKTQPNHVPRVLSFFVGRGEKPWERGLTQPVCSARQIFEKLEKLSPLLQKPESVSISLKWENFDLSNCCVRVRIHTDFLFNSLVNFLINVME